jgi:hypothetical protein
MNKHDIEVLRANWELKREQFKMALFVKTLWQMYKYTKVNEKSESA